MSRTNGFYKDSEMLQKALDKNDVIATRMCLKNLTDLQEYLDGLVSDIHQDDGSKATWMLKAKAMIEGIALMKCLSDHHSNYQKTMADELVSLGIFHS